jgi:hypothetical protein
VRLLIHRIRVVSVTAQDQFAADIVLSDGLNVLRAANSSGKTTLINAIMFGLGLEGMLGPGRQRALKSCMHEVIKDEAGKEHKVIESHVILELENGTGDKLTVRRQAHGGELSSDLIRVWDGWDTPGSPRDTYVRVEGSATREAGFHRQLEEFIGWDLPLVVRNDGKAVKLYMQLLFPFLFVEQNHGWASVRGNVPRYLQVRDPDRRAFEYLLALDADERGRAASELRAERDRIREAWTSQIAALRASMRNAGVEVHGLPQQPVATWPPDPAPSALAIIEMDRVDLPRALTSMRSRLAELQHVEVPRSGDDLEETGRQLEALRNKHSDLAVAADALERGITADEAEVVRVDTRLDALDVDRDRHRDAQRLARLGGHGLDSPDGLCPTCEQQLPTDLLGTGVLTPVMTLEENLAFIEQEQRALRAVRDSLLRRIESALADADSLRRTLAELRADIRAHRAVLLEDERVPSARIIRETLLIEDRVGRLTDAELQLESAIRGFAGLSADHRKVIGLLGNLEGDFLSSDDHAKLQALGTSFRDQLADYGFRSLGDVRISVDSYLPERAGFDLSSAVSSSDTVRLIWAYLVGLLDVASAFATHHPRLLVLDEPGQQDVEDASIDALLQRLSSVSGQVIVAITRDVGKFAASLPNTKLHELGDALVLRRSTPVV